jgi:hypothetical protein
MQNQNVNLKLPHARVLLWLDDHRGQYIPRDFANSFNAEFRKAHVTGVSDDDWLILEHGPGGILDDDTGDVAERFAIAFPHIEAADRSQHYWEAWTEVSNKAKLYLDRPNIPESQHYWTIHQDGACFLIRDDVEWCDECDGWKDSDCGCHHIGDDDADNNVDEYGFAIGQTVALSQAMVAMGYPKTGVIENILQPETSPYLIRFAVPMPNGSTSLRVHRNQIKITFD